MDFEGGESMRYLIRENKAGEVVCVSELSLIYQNRKSVDNT